MGHSIYLITQHRTKIAKGLVNLCELEIRALAKSVRFSRELKYIHYVGGMFVEKTGYSVIRLDKKIASLYHSADVEGAHGEKLSNPVMVYMIIAALCSLFIIYVFYSLSRKYMSPPHPSAAVGKNKSPDEINSLRKKIFHKKESDSPFSGAGWKYFSNSVCLYIGDGRSYFILDDNNNLVPLDFYREKYDVRIVGNAVYLKPKEDN